MPDLEELMRDLPDDDELAFARYFRRLYASYSDSDFAIAENKRAFITYVNTFIENYNIPLELSENIPSTYSENFEFWFEDYLEDVHKFVISVEQRAIRPNRAVLDRTIEFAPSQKEEIRHLLDRIRTRVDAADWTQRKKDFVHGRINALQKAVEMSRTPWEAFSANVADISTLVGEAAGNMEPAIKAIERIWKLGGKARAENRQDTLPAPEETKRLPSPEDADDGDEVPF